MQLVVRSAATGSPEEEKGTGDPLLLPKKTQTGMSSSGSRDESSRQVDVDPSFWIVLPLCLGGREPLSPEGRHTSAPESEGAIAAAEALDYYCSAPYLCLPTPSLKALLLGTLFLSLSSMSPRGFFPHPGSEAGAACVCGYRGVLRKGRPPCALLLLGSEERPTGGPLAQWEDGGRQGQERQRGAPRKRRLENAPDDR